MRRFILMMAVWLGLMGQAQAQNLDVQSVIRDQVSAFAKDDFVTAFGFADQGIQQIFKTPERFGQMVTNGYPMVLRPQKFEFTEQKIIDGSVLQYVVIEDQAGVFFLAEYRMTQTDGIWKISAVEIKRAPMVGA
jgi:hypothetical protein